MKMLEQWYDTVVDFSTEMLHEWMRLSNQAAEIVPFDITNITESMYSGPEDRVYDEKDYPNITPPYPVMWMEYRLPKKFKPTYSSLMYSGAIVQSIRLPKPVLLSKQDPMQPILDRAGEAIGSPNPNTRAVRQGIIARHNMGNTSVAWIQVWSFFLSGKQDIQMEGTSINYVDEQGAFVPRLDVTMSIQKNFPENIGAIQVPFLIALALTHAKNIKAIDQPVIPEIAARRHREKKKYFVFKELVIKPINKRPANPNTPEEDRPDKEGYTRAFHMRRGQWKDYRDGKGLFGKWHGLYWWEPHVAGDIKQGAVVKTYRTKGSMS